MSVSLKGSRRNPQALRSARLPVHPPAVVGAPRRHYPDFVS